MKKEICAWLAYALLIALIFFWGYGKLHAAEKVTIYLYCSHRELVENIGRLVQENGHDAGNEAATAALHSGDCFATDVELPLIIVAVGATYRSDGSKLQVVGLSDTKGGEPVVWSLYISHDNST